MKRHRQQLVRKEKSQEKPQHLLIRKVKKVKLKNLNKFQRANKKKLKAKLILRKHHNLLINLINQLLKKS